MPHQTLKDRSSGLIPGQEKIHCIFLTVWLKGKFLKTQKQNLRAAINRRTAFPG
jgi:hypothetical protein